MGIRAAIHKYAVMINGALVPQDEHGSRAPAAGDLLAILHEPKLVM